MKTDVLLRYVAEFVLEWGTVQTKGVEKIKRKNYVQLILFHKSCLLWDNVEKFCRAGQATDAIFMLDNKRHKHTLRTYNISFFCTRASMLRWYVRCLSCSVLPSVSIVAIIFIPCCWNILVLYEVHPEKCDVHLCVLALTEHFTNPCFRN